MKNFVVLAVFVMFFSLISAESVADEKDNFDDLLSDVDAKLKDLVEEVEEDEFANRRKRGADAEDSDALPHPNLYDSEERIAKLSIDMKNNYLELYGMKCSL
ncbi:hypothetical protein HELRODRAFT_183426 [Helobdella robusta]|uniref:Uncharacterized protein n=1 Tax=Helobdella robusta TaxID=6412 RepID=T1FJM6_HELRO|nr:hypothetical protein HELRODRAFT_183426 [Helobdella robusta]ESO11186.1 hypothetical protein HELRODRAFT_183426 [Helobdella robusta]